MSSDMSADLNVEQRLIAALHAADDVQPSDDLWSRVVHSIDEDRAHRRRVVTSVLAGVGAVAALLLVGALALTDGPFGLHVAPGVMELVETVALVVLVAVLGPAIRRFGRNYAEDLWPAAPATATALVRLLDVAYALVFAGFILLTADFSFEVETFTHVQCFDGDAACHRWSGQLEDAGTRVGGLLLIMGVLHGLTIMVLPIVALVDNSTRRGRALPRWLFVALVVVGGAAGVQLLMTMLGLLIGAAGA